MKNKSDNAATKQFRNRPVVVTKRLAKLHIGSTAIVSAKAYQSYQAGSPTQLETPWNPTDITNYYSTNCNTIQIWS